MLLGRATRKQGGPLVAHQLAWRPPLHAKCFVTRLPCMLFALRRKRMGAAFAGQSKFKLARPLTPRLCFLLPCLAGFCWNFSARNLRTLERTEIGFLPNRMPPTSTAGVEWLRSNSMRRRSRCRLASMGRGTTGACLIALEVLGAVSDARRLYAAGLWPAAAHAAGFWASFCQPG